MPLCVHTHVVRSAVTRFRCRRTLAEIVKSRHADVATDWQRNCNRRPQRWSNARGDFFICFLRPGGTRVFNCVAIYQLQALSFRSSFRSRCFFNKNITTPINSKLRASKMNNILHRVKKAEIALREIRRTNGRTRILSRLLLSTDLARTASAESQDTIS